MYFKRVLSNVTTLLKRFVACKTQKMNRLGMVSGGVQDDGVWNGGVWDGGVWDGEWWCVGWWCVGW